MKHTLLEERWIQWKPIKNLAPKYYVDSISDNLEGLILVLSTPKNEKHEKKYIKIIFEESILAYRSTDESFRMKTVIDLDERYGTDFYGNWTFFKVKNSQYISWFLEQTAGFATPEPLIHFALVAADSIVDIIAAYEPKVELLQAK